jgi:hypothetical protein
MLTPKSAVFHPAAVLIVVVGSLLSSLYVPFHVAVFHALSFAHKYNTFVHSVLHVITVPLLNDVPLLTQSAALVHEYFLYSNEFELSLTLNVILTSHVYHVLVLDLSALTLGSSLSIHVTVALQLTLFHNLSTNVTLFVPLLVNHVVCGVLVCNHTHASLADILAVTLPFVHVSGVYVIPPHTGSVASYVYDLLVHVHTFHHALVALKFTVIFAFGVTVALQYPPSNVHALHVLPLFVVYSQLDNHALLLTVALIHTVHL